ncbi:hypothetical protein VCHA54P499_120058 [Vibrio chagasii]|nr:hypothetical protein VCHA52P456_100103 [Vibrio chagasii]CAH6946448.1 hypothetical protein VCHA52P453_120032 [Vibrio chagasii]CAH6963326.1 hypothetical protein VCHA54P499_120058 [Vibrio chagasii]CAH6983962.1 hypothetical protein VCHA40P242_10070 [Vibrio chagasii]CAH7006063.1 hypothetical protein VCHA53O466_150059 [Vibrio chagasii]
MIFPTFKNHKSAHKYLDYKNQQVKKEICCTKITLRTWNASCLYC